ncbi:MAG: protein kinase [bacterium]|nr:protein kinase [bacterium]
MILAPGTKLGPYEILSELGAGGMGEVYRAHDTRLDRDVAIKVLPERFAHDEAALARFRRESKALAALSHTNIRSIYDVGTEAGRTFAVMELLDGETLAERLLRSKTQPRNAVQIGLAIAEGLVAAHGKGIIHRDIKPQNIFLTADGAVRILDFGLARLDAADADRGDLTATTRSLETSPGAVMGTVNYMSPEQVRGLHTDTRSDIFGLGCVLFEMLTGSRPFSRPTDAETMVAVLNDDPPSLAPSLAGGSGQCQRIVDHCLEKDPGRRFQSARDLAFALAGIDWSSCDGPPLGDKSPSRPPGAVQQADGPAAASIAVLPFVNLSSDPENEYFSDGLAEELIIALSKIDGLEVASRTSAFAFKGENRDVRAIGERLNVHTILEGSVRKAGARLRINAQLINVTDGYQLWSESFDRQMADVFTVQEEIGQAIARALSLVLSEGERRAIAKVPTVDVQAYDYYLRGRRFFHQQLKSDFESARQLFARAVVLDPTYARAYAGVAECCSCLHQMYHEATEDNLNEADAASRRALELDADSAEAHVARGLALSLRREYAEALEEFRHAVKLDSKLFDAHYFGARTYRVQGKLVEAAQWFEQACRADPEDYQAPHLLVTTYRGLDRSADAQNASRHALEVLERYLKLYPDDARAICFGAASHCELGDARRAREWVERAAALEPAEPRILYNVACVYALLGEAECALDWLERSVAAGRRGREWMENDPDFAALRDHPRFLEILDRM